MYSEISRAGCVVFGRGPLGKPAACQRAPTHAGLVYFEHPRPRVWLAFACEEHHGALVGARPMLERDRVELARRMEARRRVAEEGAPVVPLEPLAVGSAARRLVERARAWAERDPGRSSTVDSRSGADVGHGIPVTPRNTASRETVDGS
ncbi:hypothetical protein GCM10009559_24470 [Pseudonocardia zijingensis]|uniref:PARP-type domain-containing protein n=1 Tax=Pseudonocardia zijingensis TaxID=153376 RepID=A0ABN1PVZ7_9PSEU